MRKYLYTLSALAVLALCSSGQANAQTELVTNGGFESGNLTGWTTSGNPGAVSNAAGIAHDGTYGFAYNQVPIAFLSQTLNTTIGDTETISFWQHQIDGDNPNEFELFFDGQKLVDHSNLNTAGWVQYTFSVTATHSSSLLQFGLEQHKGDSAIDSVSVLESGIGTNASPVTPEGSSLFLLIAGGLPFAALPVLRRLRK